MPAAFRVSMACFLDDDTLVPNSFIWRICSVVSRLVILHPRRSYEYRPFSPFLKSPTDKQPRSQLQGIQSKEIGQIVARLRESGKESLYLGGIQ